jgi:thymidylate kinase
MKKRGSLIVFEGPDGVGKSFLSVRTLDHLRLRGKRCQLQSFPGKEEHSLGMLVYQLHHEPQKYDVSQLTMTSRQALHVAAHIDIIESRILPALDDGIDVILDRYWWSTFVYGIVSGIPEFKIDSLINAELTFWAGTRPSILFLVSRKEPLRSEPLDLWPRWKAEYYRLAERESTHYKILEIVNDGKPDETQLILNKEVDSIVAQHS